MTREIDLTGCALGNSRAERLGEDVASIGDDMARVCGGMVEIKTILSAQTKQLEAIIVSLNGNGQPGIKEKIGKLQSSVGRLWISVGALATTAVGAFYYLLGLHDIK